MPVMYRDEQVKRTVVTGFECNRCGQFYPADDFVEMQERLSWVNACGFGSVFGDGNRVELELCQSCVQAVLGEYLTVHEDFGDEL